MIYTAWQLHSVQNSEAAMTTSPLKTVLIEDEVWAREAMLELLTDITDIELMGSFDNAIGALDFINEEKPDLIILDIHLPVMSGMEFLSHVNKMYQPKVIIVSAYQEYALKAFKADVLDYVLKPVEPLRLKRAIDKVQSYC